MSGAEAHGWWFWSIGATEFGLMISGEPGLAQPHKNTAADRINKSGFNTRPNRANGRQG
jgi:hypothetical protein